MERIQFDVEQNLHFLFSIGGMVPAPQPVTITAIAHASLITSGIPQSEIVIGEAEFEAEEEN